MRTCSNLDSEPGFEFPVCDLPPSGWFPNEPSSQLQRISRSCFSRPSLHHSAWKYVIRWGEERGMEEIGKGKYGRSQSVAWGEQQSSTESSTASGVSSHQQREKRCKHTMKHAVDVCWRTADVMWKREVTWRRCVRDSDELWRSFKANKQTKNNFVTFRNRCATRQKRKYELV